VASVFGQHTTCLAVPDLTGRFEGTESETDTMEESVEQLHPCIDL